MGNTVPTFSTGGGKITTDLGGNFAGMGVTLQTDGKILVTGYGANSTVGLVRYNTDGSLDTSFDNDGIVKTVFGSFSQGSSVATQTDGKILVAGYRIDYSFGPKDFLLLRYNTDGSLDTSFDGDGKVSTDFATDSSADSATVQADGKILVSGNADGGNVALVRYNTNGSLDTSFDGDGKVSTELGATCYGATCALQVDGKILVAAVAESSFVLVRYNTDGSLDTSFDGDGKVTTDFGSSDYANSVTVQADGKILVAGQGTNGGPMSTICLARYNTNGSLDTSFDGDGKVTTDFATDSFGDSVTVQSDGKILVAGHDTGLSGFNFAVVRYNTNGSLDTSFDGDGKVTTDFGGSDSGFSVTTQADGKILVAGYSVINGGNQVFALARYNTDGSLDASPPADTTAPTVSTFNPIDGATGISTTSNITLSFSETIQRGTGGNIVLKIASGATVATYDAATSTNLSISGSTLTIDPTADLASDTGYMVEFENGTIMDLAGNSYTGTASYNFTTIAAATAGNDTLVGGSGDFDGGAGIDTVTYSAARATHTVIKTSSGYAVSGFELTNIERLHFSDVNLALDLGGNAGLTAKILGAVFGSSAVTNTEYVGIGLSCLDSGMSYPDLMLLALNARLGNGFSNAEEVNLLYQNLVGVLPSTADLNYYVGTITSGQFTQASLAIMAADLDLNATNIDLVGLAQTGIEFTG